MSTLLMGAVGALLALVAIGASYTLGRVLEQSTKRPESTLEARVAALEVTVKGLPSLWESERERAERSYAAARVARRSAERRAARDEPEEPSDELFGGDATPSGGNGVYPVQPSVGAPVAPAEPEHVRRARALGYPFI